MLCKTQRCSHLCVDSMRYINHVLIFPRLLSNSTLVVEFTNQICTLFLLLFLLTWFLLLCLVPLLCIGLLQKSYSIEFLATINLLSLFISSKSLASIVLQICLGNNFTEAKCFALLSFSPTSKQNSFVCRSAVACFLCPVVSTIPFSRSFFCFVHTVCQQHLNTLFGIPFPASDQFAFYLSNFVVVSFVLPTY